jgi:glycosyltransferase involved in cell wall biosynthesis
MKILFTVSTYYPLTDGVQTVTEYEAEELVKLGHDVTVVTEKRFGLPSDEIHNGVHIIRVDVSTKHTFFVGKKKEYRTLLIKLCSQIDCMINVCTQTATTELAFSILNQISCKKILYMHGMFDFKWHLNDVKSISSFLHKSWDSVRWWFHYKFSKKYIEKYDAIIHLHEMLNSSIFCKKHYNVKNYVVNNSANDSFFNDKNSFKNRENYAICVANYSPLKNQEFVLKAFYKAKTDISLVLIGSKKNEYYEKLCRLKKKLDDSYGERKVQLLYNIPRNEIADYVKGSTLYLFGSKIEMFPLSIVESMAAKIPFISTDVGIVRYFPGGRIIQSVTEMAYWIDLLSQNNSVREFMGKSGYSYAIKKFSIENNVTKMNKILYEVTKQ